MTHTAASGDTCVCHICGTQGRGPGIGVVRRTCVATWRRSRGSCWRVDRCRRHCIWHLLHMPPALTTQTHSRSIKTWSFSSKSISRRHSRRVHRDTSRVQPDRDRHLAQRQPAAARFQRRKRQAPECPQHSQWPNAGSRAEQSGIHRTSAAEKGYRPSKPASQGQHHVLPQHVRVMRQALMGRVRRPHRRGPAWRGPGGPVPLQEVDQPGHAGARGIAAAGQGGGGRVGAGQCGPGRGRQ